MLVRVRNDGLDCITQVEHGRLSGTLARKLKSDPPLSDRVLDAIAHHDDGWDREDTTPRLHRGKPRDFRQVPPDEARVIRRRCVERGREIGPYGAWLISMHGSNLPMRKTPEAIAFLEEQENLRNRLEGQHDFPPPSQRERDFDWLQFSDLLSLFLLQPDQWDESIRWDRPHPGVVSGRITGERECRLATEGKLNPGNHKFSYRYRQIEDRVYEQQRALEEQYEASKAREREIRLKVS